MSLVLQTRDHLVLRTLAESVRLLLVAGTATLRGADAANTRKRMAKLEEVSLIQSISIFAQPVPDISHPLCVWAPGDELPDPGAISWAARKRYRGISPRRMHAYVATNRTLEMYGVTSKRGNARHAPLRFKHHQATHDIGFAACVVANRHRFGEENHLVSEDVFPAEMKGWGMKVVDALLLAPERD